MGQEIVGQQVELEINKCDDDICYFIIRWDFFTYQLPTWRSLNRQPIGK